MSSALTFGYVDKDEYTSSKTFTIRNRGLKPLKLTGVSITPKSLEDQVSVEPALSELSGMILGTDEYVTVTVRIAPKDFELFSVDLNVRASGLTEAEAISGGIDLGLTAPGWSKSQGLSVRASVSSGDSKFYDESGNVIETLTSYSFGRVTSRGIYRKTYRVKKTRGKGPVIINGWDVNSGPGIPSWSVTKQTFASSSEFPVMLTNIGDYKDFTIDVKPLASSGGHIGSVSFNYYELGQTKLAQFSLTGATSPRQLKYYAADKNPGETYNTGPVGLSGTATSRKGVICVVENLGDVPLSITDTWITTSSTGAGVRLKRLNMGFDDGNWSITADVDGNQVPPGLTRAFVVWVENPNVANIFINTVTTVYAFVETDSNTNPIQRIKIVAEIVK